MNTLLEELTQLAFVAWIAVTIAAILLPFVAWRIKDLLLEIRDLLKQKEGALK